MAPSLFVRFPSLRAPRSSGEVIPVESRARYAALASDFAVLDRLVAPAFRASDLAALSHQNRYRRQQVTILLGSVVASGLGGLQAVFAEQRWPGLLLAALGIALAASSRVTSELNAQSDYLGERVKAERLRALHFRFLSRTGPFAENDRASALRRAVVAIESGREP
ncbi:hypothetical protein [Alloactinosynnema sp. L-07]|uniref:DUF4231 domain-containing protein n=1 Tax=Alloactinosynnema sp. L-07 TaxID=1653480 RepID=UPI00065F094E|nr:DUF4231 domain-containing protein [Alloactinosynnema sp. L-07]CRK59115.1 hypothetical protein [Alloactinosynnema sp. L-07]